MSTLTVGPGQQYATISAAVAASRDGDVLQVQAGTYTNDFATINTNITLQGVGGMVKMVATGNIPNDKGILVTNSNVTIDHFEFSGAKGGSGNDAGVRYESGNLTITNSYFHDNQNGLLANPSATGTITIRNSEFDHNGTGDGYTHNIYVGDIAKLTIDNIYSHDAVVGHEIKSRATETIITNSRIFDNAGNSSYSIDLPNGGKATISNNIIEQGPNGGNPNIIAFGAEGITHAVNNLTMTDNTVLNDLGRGTLLWNASNSPATVSGTKVWGLADNQMVNGSGATVTGTVHLGSAPSLDTSHPWSASGGGTSPPPPPPPVSPPPPPPIVTGDGELHAPPGGGTVQGGDGADTVHGAAEGNSRLLGGGGDDVIYAYGGNNTVNGNMGNDTIHGGSGASWLSGGKDNDLIFGGGTDTINGNLGNDTVHGSDQGSFLRGGQGDDVIIGGAGNDHIWGDRGNDTVTGGGGADTFHIFSGSGLTVVTDFNYGQGDRVHIDDGAKYTASQQGADVVVDLVGGGQMVLQHTQLTALGNGWIT